MNVRLPISLDALQRRGKEPVSAPLARYMKLSASRTILGENPERWAEEAYDELLRQHPWSSKYSVRKQMSATNDNGYAAGFFQITPREIPASVAGPSTVNVLTIPIILKDYELFPFDVFAYKGSFYPLTQERAERLLNLRDMFRETDRADFRDLIRRNNLPLSARDYGSAAYDRLPSIKFAMPKALSPLMWDDAAKSTLAYSVSDVHGQVLKDLRTSVLSEGSRKESQDRRRLLFNSIGEPLYHLLDSDGRFAFHGPVKVSSAQDEEAARATALDKLAQPAALVLKADASSVYGQILFRSDPRTGKVGLGESAKLSSYEVREQFGTKTLEQVLAGGECVVSLAPATAFEKSSLAKIVNEGLEKESYHKAVAASVDASRTMPATEHVFVRKPSASYRLAGLPEKFKGFAVNDVGMSGDSAVCAVLTDEGSLHHVSSWELQDSYVILPTNSGAKPPSIRISKGSSHRGDLPNCAVWSDGSTLWMTCYGESETEIEGTYYHSGERNGLVSLNTGFKNHAFEPLGSTVILHIPSGATLIERNTVVKGGTLGSSSEMSEEEIETPAEEEAEAQAEETAENEPSAEEEAEEETEEVKVAHDRGKYRVYSDTLSAHTNLGSDALSETDTRKALALLGASDAMIDGVLKLSQQDSLVTVPLRRVELASGYTLVHRAAEKTEKISAMTEALRPQQAQVVARLLPLRKNMSQARTKLSASALDTSVDAALSLGFLNRKNLLKFVDFLPSFDEAQSALCALLVASRLGLDEVDEESLEGAIQSMEKVLQGLRIIEMALLG